MPTKHTIYQAKYDATHRRTYGLRLHNEIDKDIIEKLASVPSMQGYIKQLIRDDIDGSSVPVSMCEAARQMLQGTADKRNIDVCDLAKLIISEWLVRNGIRT